MTADRYAEYYAAKLWQLMPAVYRSLDGVDPAAPGPLREIVTRVAGQAAVIRRSIDRLWEDQSIETCDDWLIPYIGDLVATQLVACLDPAGQRRDVANTIYYRRRKGTVGLLEELASDIASRDARIVEFFRRLGRTRHNFDPPIALPVSGATNGAPPMVVEGLIGFASGTPMGGYADLRNVYGASRTSSAFDEYYYTADFRRGRQAAGWYNIPKVGAFVWWLKTYAVPVATPVKYAACVDPVYTFDPTGREVPLFAPTRHDSDVFGEKWISPDEWQLPVPIDQFLFDRAPAQLYPSALAVRAGDTSSSALVPLTDPAIVQAISTIVRPEHGRFYVQRNPPGDGPVYVQYHYGFASEIGAGPYDQRLGGVPLPVQSDPVASVTGGGAALKTAAAALGADGTLSIEDSLTYDLPDALAGVNDVLVQGKSGQRPAVRAVAAARPQWVITGVGDATLILQGFHLVGADLVLAGEFASVQIRCMTLDPGNSGAELQPATTFAAAADGQTLWPTRLFIEATIAALDISQSITGPIRTRNGGGIETLTITDCIVQSLPESLGASAPPAIATDSGTTRLARTTVLGPLAVHRLDASECILDDVAVAEDAQHGCIRFSAYATGSVVHQPYESVTIAPAAPLFRARAFGQPDYARLRPNADEAIVTGREGASIMAGAENGSEMGAYCREKIALKRRGLTQKFAEFMPIGLVPVFIDAT